MRYLRAGLAGLGMMGQNHARVLGSLEGVELVAAFDSRPTGLANLRTFADLDEFINVGLDFCVVALPTEFHRDIGLRLASAGVCTLFEKPLASTVHECEELVAAFSEAGVTAAVGHIERYNPALQQMKVRIDDGQLGAIYQVATRRLGPFPDRIRDVGVVKDLATHDFDLTQWVTSQQYDLVFAQTMHRSGREHEDLLSVTGRLTGDVVVDHLVNWLSPVKERTVVVTGEAGCLIADTLTADISYFENGTEKTIWDSISQFRGVTEGNMVRYAIAKPEPLRTELEAFRDKVVGLDSQIVTLEEGLRVVAVAESCLRSGASGMSQAIITDSDARSQPSERTYE